MGIVRPDLLVPVEGWVHPVFVAANLVLAAGMLIRPAAFVWVFAAFALPQLVSHGLRAIEIARAEQRVDWTSLIVILALPFMRTLLVRDARERRRAADVPSFASASGRGTPSNPAP